MANEILSPEGRIIKSEHLLTARTTDIATGVEKPADKHSFECWVAFPKGPLWDAYKAHMDAAAQAAWPGGEWNQEGFSNKIADGDLPDAKGRARAAYCAGHWLVSYSRSVKIGAPPIFDQNGDMLADKSRLYNGCYVKIYGGFAGNTQKLKQGMYVNCDYVYVTRGGERIVSGPDPKAVLAGTVTQPAAGNAPGAGAATQPAPGSSATANPSPPGAGPSPHTEILDGPTPEVTYTVEGKPYTAAQLLGYGWTQAQVDALTPN